ncbi:MAG: hypothetical protein GXO87_11395 [Chlorobi bacterium]|nr:hypothetical protein [Chlorobiota bacterium]
MKKSKLFSAIITFIFLAANIFLMFLPMTNVLGFEFSIVNGIIGAFLLGFAFIHSQNGILKPKIIERDLLFQFIFFVIISLVVSILSTLTMQVCPLDDGIYFYLIFSIPSYIVGVSLAALAVLIVERKRYFVFVLLFLATLFSFADEIFFNPQIYFFNPLTGYFPGTIYDEAIKITEKIVYYRIVNLVYFIAIAFAAYRLKNSGGKAKTVFLLIVFFVAAGFGYLKPDLGFATSKAKLTKELGEKIVTDHFVVFCDRRIAPEKREVISKACEFYFSKISAILDDKPTEKIIAFVFYDDAQKKNLFGSKVADVAKPWLNQIFIGQDDFHSTLKHEMAHVFSADFGWSIFKVAKYFNPAMIEGFAMAIENDYDNLDIDYVAAFAKKNGYAFPVTELFSGFDFFGRASSISYVYSGAFIKFLLENYGSEKLKKIYGSLEFEKVYGEKLSSLSYEFEKRLDAVDVLGMKNKAQLYFGRLPIHKKICARTAALQTEKGWSLYARGYFSDAYKTFKRTYVYSGSYSSLIGTVYSLKEMKRYAGALKKLDGEIDKFDSSAYYFSLLLNYADLLALNGKIVKAETKYEELLKIAPSIYYTNLASLRLFLLNEYPLKLKEYLQGSDFDKYNILKNTLSVKNLYYTIPVLINLSKRLRENYKIFIRKLSNIKFNSSPSSVNAAFVLSEYALANGDLQLSKKFSAAAVNNNRMPEIAQALIENKEMINWISNH